MAAVYTPSTTIDITKEKEWPVSLGLLDWDSTSIVFTKRTLIEFLKYTGTTVDTNFANIAKLPRYAKFCKLSEPVQTQGPADSDRLSFTDSAVDSIKPSRRVRTVPGGPHTDIFAPGDEGDALSLAPVKPTTDQNSISEPTSIVESQHNDEEESGINFTSSIKPSRRVRTQPGGPSSLSNFWDAGEEPQEFKPTRRVRQGPGGHDSINGIF